MIGDYRSEVADDRQQDDDKHYRPEVADDRQQKHFGLSQR